MEKGKIIVATSHNMVIGYKGKMPWNYKEDLQYFKEKTLNNIVVMGRKTFESIGKPLVDRTNIILSTKMKETAGINIFRNFSSLKKFLENQVFFVIGGETIYRLFLPYINEIYLTQIDRDFKGDSYFPNLSKNWETVYSIRGKNTDLLFKKLKRKVNNEI
jgi:dihydrofolate reductase